LPTSASTSPSEASSASIVPGSGVTPSSCRRIAHAVRRIRCCVSIRTRHTLSIHTVAAVAVDITSVTIPTFRQEVCAMTVRTRIRIFRRTCALNLLVRKDACAHCTCKDFIHPFKNLKAHLCAAFAGSTAHSRCKVLDAHAFAHAWIESCRSVTHTFAVGTYLIRCTNLAALSAVAGIE